MKRRSGIVIMGKMIGLVKPLLHIMTAAVLLGTVGYLCASFLTVIAGYVLFYGLTHGQEMGQNMLRNSFLIMGTLAVLRGILHYGEQYCNHYIAFRLLAIIRHKVFAALRRLCPAKLEGREKGNLISIITTDIELLEVFYAHTISPIAIAVLSSAVMVVFMVRYHWAAALLAAVGYIVVGAVIPLINGAGGGAKGMEYRTGFGRLNSFVLDSLRGLAEILQYRQGERRLQEMERRSGELEQSRQELNRREGFQRAFTNLLILSFSFGMLFLCVFLYHAGALTAEGLVMCTSAMMVSFGPVTALSGLSNNLNQTLASGERVLNILEEEPEVEEIQEEETEKISEEKTEMEKNSEEEPKPQTGFRTVGAFGGACLEKVDFSYAGNAQQILKDYSLKLEPGRIIGIQGPSGCGKSTVLKLLLRFWDPDRGVVSVDGKDVRSIPTPRLRCMESYMTQTTHLFHDTIAANIAIGRPDASGEEIEDAARKASIHDFIMSLPKGYDTEIGELGDTLSGGERQRIGIARTFLHESPLLLLDEPTSNLDALNEGIILRSLKEEQAGRTIVLVSHRASTLGIVDQRYVLQAQEGQE